MSEAMQSQLESVANHIEDNSPVEFACTTPDGIQGRLAFYNTDELLAVHKAANQVGHGVKVRYEDDEGNVSLAFPEN